MLFLKSGRRKEKEKEIGSDFNISSKSIYEAVVCAVTV